MPSRPISSPPMKNPVTCSRPSPSTTLVLKNPLRIAYTVLNSSPALNSASPRFRRRRAYTMFSTRRRSSTHTAPGRHSSRRLQLAQVISNLALTGLKLGLMAMTAGMALPLLRLDGAFGDQLAHALEFPALVEEAARPEALGELAVRIGGEVGQHVELDLRREAADRAQHIEAAALGQIQVEHHDFGAPLQDLADRGVRARGLAGDARARDRAEQVDEPRPHDLGIFDDQDLHAASVTAAAAAPYRRTLILGVGAFLFGVRAQGLAQGAELGALVEEAARPEPLGRPAVALDRMVGQHVDRDLEPGGAQRAHHLEAVALGKMQVE